MPDAYYVCFIALPEEMQYIDSVIVASGNGRQSNNRPFNPQSFRHIYWITEPTTRRVAEVTFIVNTEMGNLGTTSLVTHELGTGEYEAAFILGLAGTMQPNIYGLGDVVVAAGAKYLGFDKIKEGAANGFAPDSGKRINADSWLRVKRDYVEWHHSDRWLSGYVHSRSGAPPVGLQGVGASLVPHRPDLVNGRPRLHQGIVFGSDWVVDSGEHLDFLMARNVSFDTDWYRAHGNSQEQSRTRWLSSDAACLDMESFGFFKALKMSASSLFHGIAVRGISDPCRDKSAVQAATPTGIRDIAARNAAIVLIDIIFNMISSDAGRF